MEDSYIVLMIFVLESCHRLLFHRTEEMFPLVRALYFLIFDLLLIGTHWITGSGGIIFIMGSCEIILEYVLGISV